MNDDAHDTGEDRNDNAARKDQERAAGGPTGSGAPVPETQERDGVARRAQDHVEELLDEGLEESFPASDPLAIPVPREPSPGKANE